MAEYLKLKKSNCVNCYKCIRHCPVKSIKYSTGQAQIVSDECILCGQCFVVCPQNAKRSATTCPAPSSSLRAARSSPSVAPSFVANYPGATIATMEKALKAAGLCRRRGDRHWRLHCQDPVRKHHPGGQSKRSSSPPAATRSTPWWRSITPRCCPTWPGMSPMQAPLPEDQGRAPRRQDRLHRALHLQKSRGGGLPRHSGLCPHL